MKVRKDLNMMEIENLIKIIDAVSESELTGLKYEEDDVKIHLTKKQGKVQVISASARGNRKSLWQASFGGECTCHGSSPRGRHSHGRNMRCRP
ncbi:MAG: hypothetical protein ACLTLQ_06515 [[Clostridium] scindens]